MRVNLLLLVAVLLCAYFHPALAIVSDPDSLTTDNNELPPILEQSNSSASFKTKDAKQVHAWTTEEYKVIGGEPAELGAYVFTPHLPLASLALLLLHVTWCIFIYYLRRRSIVRVAVLLLLKHVLSISNSLFPLPLPPPLPIP
jgi:hypothetical protein